MTIADEIREEIAFNGAVVLLEKGFDANFMAEVFAVPVEKIEKIIEKLKGESN
jgi:hypothetical protein